LEEFFFHRHGFSILTRTAGGFDSRP